MGLLNAAVKTAVISALLIVSTLGRGAQAYQINEGARGIALADFRTDRKSAARNEEFTVSCKIKNMSLEQGLSGGQFGAALVDNAGEVAAFIGFADNRHTLLQGQTKTVDYVCRIPSSVQPGKYRLRTFVRPGGGEWKVMSLAIDNAPVYINFTVVGDDYTRSGDYYAQTQPRDDYYREPQRQYYGRGGYERRYYDEPQTRDDYYQEPQQYYGRDGYERRNYVEPKPRDDYYQEPQQQYYGRGGYERRNYGSNYGSSEYITNEELNRAANEAAYEDEIKAGKMPSFNKQDEKKSEKGSEANKQVEFKSEKGSGVKYDPKEHAANQTGDWDIKALDAARNVNYLSDIEKDVILELNMVRSNPKKYAELYIQPRLKYFDGNRFAEPGKTTIITQEGATAVQECIAELSKAAGVGILTLEKGLYLAAKDHAADLGKTGQTGHVGSDGSKMSDRAKRYGVSSLLGENISYGKNTGRDIVIQLLIDDGVADRGHRKIIMNGKYSQVGLSAGTHPKYGSMCVIDYANGYKSN